jgi:hypothetical protein
MALGARVEIRQSANGAGRIVIHFASADEFDRIRAAITPPPQIDVQRQAG